MAMNRQRRTSNINNIITYDTLGNVTIPANFTVKGLIAAGFVKSDANGLFSVDTTAYQPLLPSQAGNSGKYLTTNGSTLSWGTIDLSAYVPNTRTLTINGTAYDLSADRSWTVSGANIYTADGTLTGNRIVDLGGNKLMFHNLGLNGNVRFNTNSTTNFGNQGNLMIGNPANNGALSFGLSTIFFNGVNGYHFTIATGLNDVTPTTFFQVRNSGRVLIGTTTESTFLLDVNGTARVSGALTFSGGTGVASSISYGSTYGVLIYGNTGSASDLTLTDRGGTLRFQIVNGGNILQTASVIGSVGIGTTSGVSRIYNDSIYGLVYIGNTSASVNSVSIFGDSGSNGLFLKNDGLVKIGVYNSTFNTSAILEAVSTTKGFLPPRMTTTQKNAIVSPVAGLMVFDSTLNLSSYYNGTAWIDYGNNIYNSNGTLSDNRTVTTNGNSITFTGGGSFGTNIGIGGTPNAINSLQVSTANQWSGAFIGNMAGNRTPSHAYGIHLGWNYTGGSSEANILWGTGGGGPNPYLIFSSWDGSTKVDRFEIQDTGKIVFKQYLATTSFTGTAVGYIAFDNTGGLITVPVPSGGGGSITLSAIGSSPNANAATLTGSVLNLEPASASFGGIVTTGTQSFAGAKTFDSTVTATGFFESSDKNIKQLITDNYSVIGIGAVTPKLYIKNESIELGYFAQDFIGILDSAIHDSDGVLTLSYREVLVAKIYALEQEVNKLKSKIK